MQKLSLVMFISVLLSSIITIIIYPRIRRSQFLQELLRNKARLLVFLGIVWVVIWFGMCYVVAIGMFLAGMW